MTASDSDSVTRKPSTSGTNTSSRSDTTIIWGWARELCKTNTAPSTNCCSNVGWISQTSNTIMMIPLIVHQRILPEVWEHHLFLHLSTSRQATENANITDHLLLIWLRWWTRQKASSSIPPSPLFGVPFHVPVIKHVPLLAVVEGKLIQTWSYFLQQLKHALKNKQKKNVFCTSEMKHWAVSQWAYLDIVEMQLFMVSHKANPDFRLLHASLSAQIPKINTVL